MQYRHESVNWFADAVLGGSSEIADTKFPEGTWDISTLGRFGRAFPALPLKPVDRLFCFRRLARHEMPGSTLCTQRTSPATKARVTDIYFGAKNMAYPVMLLILSVLAGSIGGFAAAAIYIISLRKSIEEHSLMLRKAARRFENASKLEITS